MRYINLHFTLLYFLLNISVLFHYYDNTINTNKDISYRMKYTATYPYFHFTTAKH